MISTTDGNHSSVIAGCQLVRLVANEVKCKADIER